MSVRHFPHHTIFLWHNKATILEKVDKCKTEVKRVLDGIYRDGTTYRALRFSILYLDEISKSKIACAL
jgi:hypothetical protein